MDILVKGSGDEVLEEDFYQWLQNNTSRLNDNLFIVPGGGTAISSSLDRMGIPYSFDGPSGREIFSESGRHIAKDVLEGIRTRVHKELMDRGIRATVYIPVVHMGGKICHVNGDALVVALYPNFDLLYVVTKKGRKKHFPKKYKKIKVVYL